MITDDLSSIPCFPQSCYWQNMYKNAFREEGVLRVEKWLVAYIYSYTFSSRQSSSQRVRKLRSSFSDSSVSQCKSQDAVAGPFCGNNSQKDSVSDGLLQCAKPNVAHVRPERGFRSNKNCITSSYSFQNWPYFYQMRWPILHHRCVYGTKSKRIWIQAITKPNVDSCSSTPP